MQDSLKVAKWEIKTIIRNKTFLIMTFFVPIMILIIGGAVGFFAAQGGETDQLVVGIQNQSQVITNGEIEALETTKIDFVFFNNINEDEITATDIDKADANDLLDIIINQEGKVMVNNKDLSFLNDVKFKEFIYTFITNPDDSNERASSPKNASIQINHYNHPEEYETYLTYIREVYYYLWNTEAQEKYEVTYNELDCKKRSKTQKVAPYRIFEAKDRNKQKKKEGPRFIGPPAFDGDVIDN